MIRKAYLSGPVSGTSDYRRRFKEAEDYWSNLESCTSIINPIEVNRKLPGGCSYEDLMRMCMTMLQMCDAIIMLKGWLESPGARAERAYALAVGMEVICE